MRDISNFKHNLSDYSGTDRVFAEEINELLAEYERDMEAIETVYDVLGYRPWYIDFDENGGIKSCIWSDRYRKKLGFTDTADFPNSLDSWIRIIDEADRDRIVNSFWDTVNNRSDTKRFDEEYIAHKKDGERIFIRSAGIVRRREDGSPISFMGLSEDITQLKQNFLNLQEQYEIVEALSRDYLNIFMVDIPNRTASIIKLDGYVTQGFGDKNTKSYPYEPFCAQYIKDRVYIEDQEKLTEMMSLDKVREMLEKNNQYEYGYRAVDNGEIHFYQFTYLKLVTKSGYDKVIAGFKNIDAIVASANETDALRVLSQTDIMTGVFNRGHGEKVSKEYIETGKQGMFCILDLDRFKEINDTYGHDVGDKALIAVARSLKKVFGSDNIVFRLGGDEFSAIAGDVTDPAQGRKIIESFFDDIEHIGIPELSGSRLYTSVGAIFFGIDESEGNFEELYKKADRCVYESKKTAGNKVTFYNS